MPRPILAMALAASSFAADWNIGNAKVTRTLSFDPAAGLQTVSWRHLVTGTEFARKAERRPVLEFEFLADAAVVNGRSVSVELIGSSSAVLPRGGRELRVRMRAKAKPLEVTAHYAVYGDHPAIRKWLSIRNLGDQPVTLTQLCFESYALAPGPTRGLETFGGYGTTPRELFFTGRAADIAMGMRNSLSGEGFVALNEAPGFLKRTEMNRLWDPQLQAMYDTDLFPFERRLAPGEEFVTAACSTLFFADGRSMASARWVVPPFVSRVLAVRPDFASPWIYNTWMPFRGDIGERLALELIPRAAGMGFDIFTLDGGWEAFLGSNDLDARKFPNGAGPIRTALEKQGMKLGLWAGMAEISVNSEVAREHPEWLCLDRHGQKRMKGATTAVMCIASGYRDWIAGRLITLIERYQAAYLKIDLTTVFNSYGDQPGCFAQGHHHATWAESLSRGYESLQYIAARVHARHPETLLDYTFELWGEKHLIDHALIASAEMDWLSNVFDTDAQAAGPIQSRALLYPRAFSIPPDAMLIGNLRPEIPVPEEHFGTAIGSAPLFCGDLRKLSPEQVGWYGRRVRWFKDLRKRVALDTFIPVGSWEAPSAARWDGFARLSRRGEGVLALFANDSGVESAAIRIAGMPDGEFRVRDPFGELEKVVSGEQLRRGWKVQLAQGAKAVVLEILRPEK